ncbi:MAG: hypothetical protein M1826_000188 [Phylliscum demangeonii]|nr:MAG: hypothetical protein M1826_000188 [Phylliscum demangeonii]
MRSIVSLSAILALLACAGTVAGTCVNVSRIVKSWDFHDAPFGPITQYDNHTLARFNITAISSTSQSVPSDRQLTFAEP